MGNFSKSDIDRIISFVASNLNGTQRTIVCEVNGNFKSSTECVNHIAEKHQKSRSAVWHSFRILRDGDIINANSMNNNPQLTKFGKKIKEVIENGNDR